MAQTRFGMASATHSGSLREPTQLPEQTAPAPRQPIETTSLAALEIRRGPDAGVQIGITGPRLTIGRDRDRDVVLDDSTVSMRHAELRFDGDRYVLVDGGSLNGIYVNRQPVQQVELSSGDELWIGKARFIFHVSEQ